MHTINLNDPRIMSSSEAAKMWGVDESSIRKRLTAFPEGTIRKFGKQWVVTNEGMNHVFQKQK